MIVCQTKLSVYLENCLKNHRQRLGYTIQSIAVKEIALSHERRPLNFKIPGNRASLEIE